MVARITLLGKLFLKGEIKALTGLHIGGAQTGMEIGGVDNIVIRDPITNLPYVPGSSLKGKMRSLMERKLGLPLNRTIRTGRPQVRIHECEEEETYKGCVVCRLFGVAGERDFATPTRLYVRDVKLSQESREELEGLETELPYTEVKWEAAIDRVTSAAVPRQFERVPAGAVFSPVNMVFNFYSLDGGTDDFDLLRSLFQAMELLEDDYVGGMGSRGYGQVAFRNLSLSLKTQEHYLDPTVPPVDLGEFSDLKELREKEEEIIKSVKEALKVSEAEHAPSEA